MSYLVLARKWRPAGFEDLVGQEPIMRILKNAISQGRIAHAYIFSGPRGVGKTSSARILAKALNCKEGPTPAPCGVCNSCTAITDGSSVDVIEIDGASNNSVDDIRDLRERVKYAPSGGKYKVYIIDEVHMLSGSAFNALLKTLEEPPPHVIFVLATTEMKKIPATVLSRCQHMPFRRIPGAVIRDRLKNIAESENINITPAALGLIARAADGSMRDSLTILDQIFAFSAEIDEENVKNLLGITDFGLLAKASAALIKGDRSGILDTVNLLSEQGTDIRSFTKELVWFFRDLLVASVVHKPGDALDLGNDEMKAVREIVSLSSEEQLTLILSEIIKAETDVRHSSSPRLALEMAMIRGSFLSTMKPLRDVIEHIGRYKKQAGDPMGDKSEAHTYGDDRAQDKPCAAAGTETGRITLDAGRNEQAPDKMPEGPAIADARKNITDISAQSCATDMEDAWKRTIARIEPPLASKLVQSEVRFGEKEISLTLDGGHAVFADSITKNIKTLEKILSEEAGSRIRITLAASAKKSVRRNSLKDKVMSEPLIKEALELFDGRIVDVKPVDMNENNKNGGSDV